MSSKIQRLGRFEKGAEYVLTSTAIVLAGVISTDFTLIPGHQRWSGFGIGLVLLLLAHVGVVAIKSVLDNSRLLRRWLLRDQFFEGVWVDVVEEEPRHFAIVQIEFRDGAYEINGEAYAGNASFLGNWKSSEAWATSRQLRYTYRGSVQNPAVWDYDGMTEYNFVGNEGGAPNTFSGFYVDLNREPVRKRIRGQRVSSADAKRLADLATRRKLLLEWGKRV